MPQSRQPQRQTNRRAPPPLPRDDDFPELRDPNDGNVPAVSQGRAMTVEGDSSDPQQAAAALYPQFIPPPCYTIADEQRDRAAEVEEMGLIAWIDAHDSRTEEEKQDGQLQVAGAGQNLNVVKSGGGRLPNRNRQDDEYAA